MGVSVEHKSTEKVGLGTQGAWGKQQGQMQPGDTHMRTSTSSPPPIPCKGQGLWDGSLLHTEHCTIHLETKAALSPKYAKLHSGTIFCNKSAMFGGHSFVYL